MMPELLCHLLGDYVLQNHWMANEKTKHAWVALAHALMYMTPFVLWLHPSLPAYCTMCLSHAIIDRYRLAKYWVEFYGIGLQPTWRQPRHEIAPGGEPYVEPGDAPPFLQVWLLIIVDNTFHLLINYFSLRYL